MDISVLGIDLGKNVCGVVGLDASGAVVMRRKGPVVLAQDEACCRRPFSISPTTELNSRLIREGEGLRFRMTNIVPERHTRYLQPLYSAPGFWPYWIYFDLASPALY